MTNVEAIVLAAGTSSRFGGSCKLTVAIDGVPIIRRVAVAALESRVSRTTVVTGRFARQVRACLRDLPVSWVHNAFVERGLSYSVACGLSSVGEGARGVVICLGDMPLLRSAHVDALCDTFLATGGRLICVPSYEGQRGNPVLWPARFFNELMHLQGDTGGRSILSENPLAVRSVKMLLPGVNIDVDTPEDLMALRRGN